VNNCENNLILRGWKMEWTEKQNDTSGSEGSAKGKGRRARNELEI
jgi:hypothetical protein